MMDRIDRITITNKPPDPLARAIAALKELTAEQRLEVFNNHFCKECGRELTHEWDRCSCWNDE